MKQSRAYPGTCADKGKRAKVRTPPRQLTRAAQTRRTALWFVLPAVLFFLLLSAYPLLRVLWQSVRYANLVNPSISGFAGLDNFRTVLDDDDFLPALGNTALWTALSVTGEYALGLISALALNANVRGRAFFRAAIIVPWVIPIVVAGLTWTWMLTPEYGVLNLWMVQAGLIHAPIAWLGQTGTALLAVTLVNIWRSFPFYTISLLAALQAIPADLHEAAVIDGAGSWMRFRVITLPHLRVVSVTLIVIHIVWTAVNFDFIWVMTQGGPLNSSETLPIMIYRYALQNFDVGAGCALATMMMGFMASVFFMQYYGMRRIASSQAGTA